MKCFVAIALFALVVAAALAKPTTGEESIEPAREAPTSSLEAARNKRGLLLGAYTAPIAYSAYTAPAAVAYSAYSYPYAYTAYSSYPYYAAAYSAPYYLA